MYVVDMHCDTISKLYHQRNRGQNAMLQTNELQIDIEKLKRGEYLLQNFAVFVDLLDGETPYQCAKNQIALFLEEMEQNRDSIRQVMTFDDILENRRQGRISALLTLEEGEACEGDLRKLEEFYREGVRMMTFTWNYENSLGTQDGLTDTGIQFLHKMEEIGIIPDVSHLSEKGFYDVCRHGTRPFVASHSNASALCPHKRNLSDAMIRAISARGGVIGVNYYGLFLEEKEENGRYYSKVSRIADHVLHMIHVGGISCVGLGSDFDGIDHNLQMADCSQIGLLESELRKRGVRQNEIEAIFFGNVLRIYQEYL